MEATNSAYWRMRVLARDNFTCQKCGSTNNPEAHHIKSQFYYPHLSLELDNGKTLCEDCHKKIPTTLGFFYWVGKELSEDGWFYRNINRRKKPIASHRHRKETILAPIESLEDRVMAGYLRLLSRFCLIR